MTALPPWGYQWQPQPWYDPQDGLVNPPGAGLSGWFARAVDAVRRGWPALLLIMLLTQALPLALISLVQLRYDPSRSLATIPPATPDGEPPTLPEGFVADIAVFGGATLGATIIAGLVQSVGWAAGTWLMARRAAGLPAPTGAAFRYGVRRGPGLWLWTLLCGLILLVGVCACVLPGIYFAFALSLVGPVFLFERRNPIGRSFTLFHTRFGMVLGRVALLAVALIIGGLATALLQSIGLLLIGGDPLAPPEFSAGTALANALPALLSAPLAVVQLVALVITYAEQRGHEARTTAATLAAELG